MLCVILIDRIRVRLSCIFVYSNTCDTMRLDFTFHALKLQDWPLTYKPRTWTRTRIRSRKMLCCAVPEAYTGFALGVEVDGVLLLGLHLGNRVDVVLMRDLGVALP